MTLLRKWGQEHNISDGEIARGVGVTRSAITHIANGDWLPSLTTAVAIEEFTNGAVPCASWLAAA